MNTFKLHIIHKKKIIFNKKKQHTLGVREYLRIKFVFVNIFP